MGEESLLRKYSGRYIGLGYHTCIESTFIINRRNKQFISRIERQIKWVHNIRNLLGSTKQRRSRLFLVISNEIKLRKIEDVIP